MPIEMAPIEAVPPPVPRPASGLRHGFLSPLETISQSVSAIAPTVSPALNVPLVFALAGNGTWLAYLLALGATMLIALCIAKFASYSAAPGSLYKYATDSLPPIGGSIAGWALLFAYVATGASTIGGFINYARVLMHSLPPAIGGPLLSVPTALIALIATAAATWLAYKDVQASAQVMLWIEAVSVSMIAVVVLAVLYRHGPHVDLPQVELQGVTASGVRLGLVLSLFSFVGFESATTLGHEAINPLRTIPRAVLQSALLAGFFFLACAYTETLGFRALHMDLGRSEAPLVDLSVLAHMAFFGPLINIGAFISMFACTLACITAAARVLLHMAEDGLAHPTLARAHATNETPHIAVLATGTGILLLSAFLAARGYSGLDIYAWVGSLAVYGFLTAYGLVAAALPFYLRHKGHLTPAATVLAGAATVAMLLGLIGTLYPVPIDRPYTWLPYAYLAYLAITLGWFWFSQRTEQMSRSR